MQNRKTMKYEKKKWKRMCVARHKQKKKLMQTHIFSIEIHREIERNEKTKTNQNNANVSVTFKIRTDTIEQLTVTYTKSMSFLVYCVCVCWRIESSYSFTQKITDKTIKKKTSNYSSVYTVCGNFVHCIHNLWPIEEYQGVVYCVHKLTINTYAIHQTFYGRCVCVCVEAYLTWIT